MAGVAYLRSATALRGAALQKRRKNHSADYSTSGGALIISTRLPTDRVPFTAPRTSSSKHGEEEGRSFST